ncbi:MAG TPA: glutamate racemase [Acidobacteriaceae bacterium]|jgi:glutamate racemase|nr:glutamate racemase [Acidobacteriaceae bacterium]
MNTRPLTRPTIGIFDSGFGGLTVMRALLALIPNANYVYLGDTARLPYGSKSQETIARYAVDSLRFLEAQGAELFVVACNTASALALDALKAEAKIPVVGVIEPGAAAARAAYNLAMSEAAATDLTSDGVLVLATEATVQSHAYARACAAHGLRAFEKACPLLVPLVEEGWIDHPVTEEVARIYLGEALAEAQRQKIVPHTVLLGCTHYPLLQPLLECVLLKHFSASGPMGILDSAEATARHVKHLLSERAVSASAGTPSQRFFATDSVEKFQRLGSRFLGCPIDHVQHVDLGG